MGSEVESDPSSTLKLPLFSIQPTQSPDPSGMLTPPLQTSASVPFRWEEQPGKPRPCTTLTNFVSDFSPKCLELPPRLLLDTKLLSPNNVLEGPYVGRSKFHSSSFRIIGGECYGSFSHERERGQLGAMVIGKRGSLKEKPWFGSWGKRVFKGKREVGGGSHVFPSSVDRESDTGERNSANFKIKRTGRSQSLSGLSHASSHHFWATIYDGLKQVVPWSKKFKKDGHVV